MKTLARIVSIAALTLLAGAPTAAALPTGSGGTDAPAPPLSTTETVNIGDYCASTYAPTRTVAQTADGQTVYCVQVKRTDAYVWWPVNEELPVDPHHSVSPGDDCLGEGEQWVDGQGRAIQCNKTQNGRLRGNLVWQLQH
ncbi:hypothetical protein [Nocardia sp. CC227C]|uniref:hypothetical protein n=1 Tax=Nocardia sp. CC227C TaxID=3044562 RepID=UPI00278BC077|nr:hypothetical protein [Nocardia sp. CC227C]